MKRPLDVPPGFLPVWMDSGAVLVIPIAVYLAGLKLGKTLQRRASLRERVTMRREARQWPVG